MSINWNNIRPLNNSLNDGFEELIRQLARREEIEGKHKFVPLGKPDAGVECFWILDNGDEWGWQAKFFTASLTTTQWGEIDHSVETAIDKHPNLKKYIIALPIDPPDARLKNQRSFLDKWDVRVAKWKKWGADKGLTINFEPWWSSDLISRLLKPENAGLTYYFFSKEEFTDEWCEEQTELSITELGKRYTPELNVKLEVSKIFDGIARDDIFEKQIKAVFDDFFIKGNKIIVNVEELKTEVSELQSKIHELYQLFINCEFRGVDNIPYTEIEILLVSIRELAECLRSYCLKFEREIQDKKKEYGYYQKYGSELYALQKFASSLESVSSFISSPTAKLSNNPILLLDGEAGIGKSHLIADVVRNRNSEGKPSLILLGQHFVTDEDPWTQIFKRLNVKCTTDEFLGALNSKAEITGSRLILFIDAVNEGRGKYFWSNNIKSFIKKIAKYKWLGLVLSVRTSYKKLMFPPDEWHDDDAVTQYTHYGFREVEYEATKLFFGAYGIQLPNVPLLHPEFQNPLFLKLFCDGLNKLGYSKIPDGLQGITSIIEFFVNSINLRLSQPERLEYPSSINVVKKAIDILIAEKIDKKLRYIPYESAYVLVEKIIIAFSAKRGLLGELISEGVLSKNLFWESDGEYEEGVYLAYERFEDHLTTSFLLDRTSNINIAFTKDGDLFYLVEDERACYINKGLIEAFSIQLPEKTGKEFYEYVPHIAKTYPVIESFVQSLLWRKVDTISEKLTDYVNTCVLAYRKTHEFFWDTLLSVTAVPNHYFNAYSLHKNLMRFSLPDRDAWWTAYLKNQLYENSAVKRLVDWAWNENNKDHISDESIKLTSIALAWFHTSTNRKLRDSATKALICLLENRINVLVEVLKEFDDVNDPYVYERLFAVAYGCAIRTKQKDALQNLSQYIYETIFDTEDEIYPHILLRDYARGVIEYTSHLGIINTTIDISKVRPPYKSSFPEEFPNNEEIDSKYKFDYKSKDFKDYYWAQNNILSSMTTEYGRGTGGYGDFGRYVFQQALESWDVDKNSLSNLATEWIFQKYGYDVEKHGKFDREIGSGRGRDTYPHERIGKKYQWLAFYEMLARVSDNFSKYSEWDYKKESNELHEGPWSPYVRDIDPTITIKSTGKYNEEELSNYWWTKENYTHWNLPNEAWIKQINDLPLLQGLINVVDTDGVEWLVLEGHPEWAEPKALGIEKYDMPHKRLWLQIRSYFVHKNDFEKMRNWAKQQNFMGKWMPESQDRHEVFSREYYWSSAHKYFQKEYYSGIQWQNLQNRGSEKIIAPVMVTCESYLWEEEFDASKDSTLHILKPCADLYERMKLIYSNREGEFVDKSGKLICFDPSVYHACKSFLLIKKDNLLKYLRENNLQIIWTVLGEKNIIGGWLARKTEFVGRQEINGVYYMGGDIITGECKIKITL